MNCVACNRALNGPLRVGKRCDSCRLTHRRAYQNDWDKAKRASGFHRIQDYVAKYAYEKAQPGYNAKIAVRAKAAYHANPERRAKCLARAKAQDRVRRGVIVRQPCERCGAFKAESHHEDYSKPLAITWLCRECHKARHAELDKG